MADVLTLDGKPINWASPPRPNTRARWSNNTMGGKPVISSFRSLCHLTDLDNKARTKFGSGIVVIQSAYNTGVKASAGTHDYSECFDLYIPGASWSDQQKFLRANGFACWWRKPPAFGNHIHGFSLPPRSGSNVSDDFLKSGIKVGKYVDGGWSLYGKRTTSSQIEDYYEHKSGLAGHRHDPSWFPANIPATIFDFKSYVARRAAASAKPGEPVIQYADIVVATNNVMSLPKNPKVQQTLNATPQASVVMVQEVDLPSFKAALSKVPGMKPVPIPDGDVYNAAILYDPKVWTLKGHRYELQFEGRKGIAKTRHYLVARLYHRVLRREVVFISWHDVTRGNDAERVRMREAARKRINDEVAAYQAQGIPVIVGGDANQRTPAFWTSDMIRAHGIDHIYAWRGKAFKWIFKAQSAVNTPSDHDAFVVRFKAKVAK